jgi:hypothetical protein
VGGGEEVVVPGIVDGAVEIPPPPPPPPPPPGEVGAVEGVETPAKAAGGENGSRPVGLKTVLGGVVEGELGATVGPMLTGGGGELVSLPPLRRLNTTKISRAAPTIPPPIMRTRRSRGESAIVRLLGSVWGSGM